MVDPITEEEELRRSRRINQYQQYQNNLEELDKTDGKKDSNLTGDMQGKKIKKIESENSPTASLFNKAIQKKS